MMLVTGGVAHAAEIKVLASAIGAIAARGNAGPMGSVAMSRYVLQATS